MTAEKIFVITNMELSKEITSSKNKERKEQPPVFSTFNFSHGLHILSILGSSGVAISVLTLIPRHNSILESVYWFEILLPAGVGMISMATNCFLDLSILMRRKPLISIDLYLKIVMVSTMTFLTSYCLCYVLWATILQYNPPMPFFGLIGIQSAFVAQLISIPFFIPFKFMKKEQFKCKLKIFILYESFWVMVSILKVMLARTFKKFESTDAQCIIAFLIPITQEFTNFVLSKLMIRIVGSENEKANVLVRVSINFSYDLFIAVSLVDARSTTIFCMAVIEFLTQVKMSYQIVKLHKKVTIIGNERFQNDKNKAVLTLLLAELCEGLVPLAYAIGFVMAYFGPNAKLIGNIRCDLWHYREVVDVSWNLSVLFGLFAIDLVCLSLNSIIIWIFSNVNIFQELCSVLQRYWYIMALKLINNLYFHFFANDVNLAMDWTKEFFWITNNKTITQMTNSAALGLDEKIMD